jgi:secreted PhoX family phosphatase
MGEDARFEYIYKFFSRDRVRPGDFAANRDLLDHGTLYVARFGADGTGEWLPLMQGIGPLTAANGFADQGEALIKARQASDAPPGATKMDRSEWIAVDAIEQSIYCNLTNDSQRGAPGRPPGGSARGALAALPVPSATQRRSVRHAPRSPKNGGRPDARPLQCPGQDGG